MLYQKQSLTSDTSTLHQALSRSCLAMLFHLAGPLMESTSKKPLSCSYHAAVSLTYPGPPLPLFTGIMEALVSLPYKAFPQREASIICLKQWVIFPSPLQSTPVYFSSISQVRSWPRQVFPRIWKVFKLLVWRVLHQIVSEKLTGRKQISTPQIPQPHLPRLLFSVETREKLKRKIRPVGCLQKY